MRTVLSDTPFARFLVCCLAATGWHPAGGGPPAFFLHPPTLGGGPLPSWIVCCQRTMRSRRCGLHVPLPGALGARCVAQMCRSFVPRPPLACSDASNSSICLCAATPFHTVRRRGPPVSLRPHAMACIFVPLPPPPPWSLFARCGVVTFTFPCDCMPWRTYSSPPFPPSWSFLRPL